MKIKIYSLFFAFFTSLNLLAFDITTSDEESNGFIVYKTEENQIFVHLESPEYGGAWEAGVVKIKINEREYEFSYEDGKTVSDLAMDIATEVSKNFVVGLRLYQSAREILLRFDKEDGPQIDIVNDGPVYMARISIID